MPPLLILDTIEDFLDRESIGSGPVTWERIGEGQSNVTYRLSRGGHDLVLRRGPRPPYPPSAHNMVREAKLLQALQKQDAKVPKIVAICEDTHVLGVPFYLMEFIEGAVITDVLPAWADGNDSRQQLAQAAVDELARLHQLDVSVGPLSTFGKQDGYLERQIALFTALWSKNTRRDVPSFHVVADWLAAHQPVSQRVSVVHGDYRIGNLMFESHSPVRLAAILDWEMATIGDPLADLGYFVATYSSPDRPGTVMDLTPVTSLVGFPDRGELVARYAANTGLVVEHLGWYEVLALWKAAVFCEAMYSRWLDGERPGDDFGPRLEEGVLDLLQTALRTIDR